jgi:hypothetical protein
VEFALGRGGGGAWQMSPGHFISIAQPRWCSRTSPDGDGRWGRTESINSACMNSMTISSRSGHGAFPSSDSAGAIIRCAVPVRRTCFRQHADPTTAVKSRSWIGLSLKEKSDVFR